MSRSEVEKLYQRGRRLIDEGKYQEACQMMKEANEKGQFLAKNDLLRAQISHELGFVLWKLNENAEAEIHFRIALGIKEMVMQPNDNETAISLNMLGLTLKLQGKLEEAERVGERTINMLRVSPNKDDKSYARALHNLAETLRRRGKFEASETMFRESLEIMRKTFGKNHQETAWTLNNLGLTLEDLKKFESAEAAYRESLEIKERVYGRKHKETARTLNNLGACLNAEGKFTEAVDVLREAVSIEHSVSDSPEFKERSLNWLLKSLNDDGNFQQAEEEYQRWFRFEDLPLGNPNRKGGYN